MLDTRTVGTTKYRVVFNSYFPSSQYTNACIHWMIDTWCIVDSRALPRGIQYRTCVNPGRGADVGTWTDEGGIIIRGSKIPITPVLFFFRLRSPQTLPKTSTDCESNHEYLLSSRLITHQIDASNDASDFLDHFEIRTLNNSCHSRLP